MKKAILAISFILTAVSAMMGANRAETIVKEMHDPSSKKVLVACHRGDWRNYPENSLAAIESVIRMGADIVEIDLALTKDSVLVVCHDRTIDRTTSGKGLIADITYDSIARVNLKSGHGVRTKHKMPTLRDALELCKDRIVINIDKGYDYYDLILPISDSLGMTDQLLIKGKKPVKTVAEKMASHRQNMMYMPIIDILKSKGKVLFKEYMATKTVPLAYEVCWDRLTPEVTECMQAIVAQPSKLWVNSLWESLNGGLDDDAAFDGNPADIYGKLVDMGATIIQTDRPVLLLDYLRSRNLHD
ncbi:glycerophosphodiester phosphodiesterase family protein [uncultured Muribaculum sp.]|uniref:glycerophosphodiester phosphodiesterase family protein n=1 Tax=uncultured Muribaculum sp. TaxID=1918613 RepID=UPI0025F83108|nr:glycerophosphodiester phosphodiesterase family protein [uncultured Muribaculum sp.]